MCLILGDNFFHASNKFFEIETPIKGGTKVFAYRVEDPERYGVVEFDKNKIALSMRKNQRNPKAIMQLLDYISTTMMW